MSENTQAPETKAIAKKDLQRTEKHIAQSYGERTEIREMVDRIRAGLPNANKIPDSGIIALATVAFAHDLDPFIGEIWVIYNEKKDECSLMPGIRGQRKVARRQMPERELFYTAFRPVPEEEYARYGLNQPDDWGRKVERAEICVLRRSDATSAYIESLDRAHKITGSYEEGRKLIGDPPVWEGLGIVRVGEKSKMEREQLVRKRAESDALKQAFDMPFRDAESTNDDAVVVGYGEDVDGDVIKRELVEKTGSKPPVEALIVPERPMSPDELEAYVELAVERRGNGQSGPASEKQVKLLGGLLKGLYKGSPTAEKDAASFLQEVTGKTDPAALSIAEASVLIDLIKSPDADDWGVRPEAQQEAARVLARAMKAEGQLDLFGEDSPELAEKVAGLKAMKPPSWEVGAAYLARAFPEQKFTGAKLEEAVRGRMKVLKGAPLVISDPHVWAAAIDIAAQKNREVGKEKGA